MRDCAFSAHCGGYGPANSRRRARPQSRYIAQVSISNCDIDRASKLTLPYWENWARQLLVDVAAGNRANALGTAASLH